VPPQGAVSKMEDDLALEELRAKVHSHHRTPHNTTAQHHTALHNARQDSTVHNTTQDRTTQHNTTQHNTRQDNTAPHHTAPIHFTATLSTACLLPTLYQLLIIYLENTLSVVYSDLTRQLSIMFACVRACTLHRRTGPRGMAGGEGTAGGRGND
jgi:hypothetical protein